MLKKILVIGANGQLGTDLVKVLTKKYQVIGSTREDFDVTNQKEVSEFIIKHHPDGVIHTAAFHRVADCEVDPVKSFEQNGVGAFNTAQAARSIGAFIIYISTDYIFDGTKKGYKEDDKPNPINIYGASKLLGEQLVKAANPEHYIIRTSWLYGSKVSSKGHNFPQLMLKKALEGQELAVVDDQFGSPTYTLDLANQIKELIKIKAAYGTYHMTNDGVCSWHDFARLIFKTKGLNVKISKIKTDTKQPVRRPRYSVLLNNQSKKVGLPKMRSWKYALSEYLQQN